MKGSMPGPRNEKEETMKLMSKADLWRVNNRRLDAKIAEIRRNIGAADREIRKGYGAIEDIRHAQKNRRVQRPNL
jgi:uncharacterized coiled-coil DUF342 family protein